MWERLAKTLHFLELITANANLDPKLDKQPETLQQIPMCVWLIKEERHLPTPIGLRSEANRSLYIHFLGNINTSFPRMRLIPFRRRANMSRF